MSIGQAGNELTLKAVAILTAAELEDDPGLTVFAELVTELDAQEAHDARRRLGIHALGYAIPAAICAWAAVVFGILAALAGMDDADYSDLTDDQEVAS